ncbi:MAG: hypothetical protein ACO1RT_04150 [Planctomycetaceae bacterium]
MAGLYANDWMLRFAAKRNPATRMHFLLTTPPRTDSVAVLGSSMLASAISTRQLSGAIDGSAIQLAVGGQGLQEQALIWDLYRSRHRCDTLVLELHEDSLRIGTLPVPLREDRYAVYLDQPLVRQHLRAYSGAGQVLLWRSVPMWAFAEFSTKIGWHDWVGYLKATPYDPHAPAIYSRQGPMTRAGLLQSRWPARPAIPAAVDPDAASALKEILDSAAQAGVHVVLVHPPWFDAMGSGTGPISIPAVPAAVAKYPLFHFSPSSRRDPRLFDDRRHASAVGARQFTQELAEEILRARARS